MGTWGRIVEMRELGITRVFELIYHGMSVHGLRGTMGKKRGALRPPQVALSLERV